MLRWQHLRRLIQFVGLYSSVFNVAAVAGVVLELACGSKGWDANSLYVIQSVIAFVLGFDISVNALLEFITARAAVGGSNHTIRKETIVSVVVVPNQWLMLCTAILSSQSYDCDDMPCRSKHYLYPLLFIFRNHRLYMSLFAFG